MLSPAEYESSLDVEKSQAVKIKLKFGKEPKVCAIVSEPDYGFSKTDKQFFGWKYTKDKIMKKTMS